MSDIHPYFKRITDIIAPKRIRQIEVRHEPSEHTANLFYTSVGNGGKILKHGVQFDMFTKEALAEEEPDYDS